LSFIKQKQTEMTHGKTDEPYLLYTLAPFVAIARHPVLYTIIKPELFPSINRQNNIVKSSKF